MQPKCQKCVVATCTRASGQILKCNFWLLQVVVLGLYCPWSIGSKYAKIPKFGYDLGYHATENVLDSAEFTRFDGSEDLETHF